jgi:hypothetical protein
MTRRFLFLVALVALAVTACSKSPRNNTSWRKSQAKIKTVYPLTSVGSAQPADTSAAPDTTHAGAADSSQSAPTR